MAKKGTKKAAKKLTPEEQLAKAELKAYQDQVSILFIKLSQLF